MKQAVKFSFGVFVFILGGLVFFLLGQDVMIGNDDFSGDAPISRSPNLQEKEDLSSAPPGAVITASAIATGQSALPPVNAKVSSIFADLVARSARGDSAAACRLSADLAACATNKLAAAAIVGIANDVSQQREGGVSLDQADSMLSGIEAQSKMCEGVTQEMISHAYELQKQAAKASPDRYSGWLAANPALDKQNFLSQIESWKDYQVFAKSYYERLLESQDLKDLPLLLVVYAPNSVSGARPPYRVNDPDVFLALYSTAKKNGIKVSAGIDQAAQDLGYGAGIVPEHVFSSGWHGVVPPDAQRALTESMYPALNSASFCK
jgi:hypothetical protein